MLSGVLIGTLCSSVSLFDFRACQSASEAFIIQTGIQNGIVSFERYTQKRILNSTPTFVKNTVSYGVVAQNFLNGREIKVDFKIPNLCDKMELGASVNSGSFNLKWIF
jgi:hypothetical protein